MATKALTCLTAPFAGSLLVLGLALAPQERAAASEAVMQRCVFDSFPPVATEPYYVDESAGSGPENVLRGAALFVVAREGLTKEWLELSVKNAFAVREQAKPGCLPKVRNVELKVGSGGTGFWIYVGSEENASELVRWATSRVAIAQKQRTQSRR